MANFMLDRFRPLMALVVFSILAGGCDTGPADSLFDPERGFQPDPVITRIEPSTALAGIGTLTIVGENFSSVPGENLVFFGDTRATVLQASSTQLVVATPNLPQADLVARVSVVGAENLSNTTLITLEAAVVSFGDVKDFEDVFGIATDDAGNVYVSLFSSNVSAGIKRITPDGVRSDYAPSTFKWDALDFDEAGFIYGVRNVRAIFRIPPGGGDFQNWVVAEDRSARFRELDVDSEGNVWVGGSGGNFYRIDPSGQVAAFPTAPSITALKVGGGFVYVVEELEAGDRIVRYRVEPGGTLGTPEFVFTAPSVMSIQSLAVAAGDEVLVGTDATDPILIVSPFGSSEALYPGLFAPIATGLAWDPSSNLYMVKGRTASSGAAILRINTQRDAAE